MTSTLIIVFLFVYILALFAVAWRGDRQSPAQESPRRRAMVYGLSIAVYFTSWTYYGAVGTAARTGWQYLPIYLGPILAITIGFPLWRKIAVAAKLENVGSIADFLASRYGKSQTLGTLVACVTLIGTAPYTALQLKSLSMAWAMVSEHNEFADLAVPVIAATLAGFAILFGARRPTLTEHSRGLVRAVALESIVKLAALTSVAVLGVIVLSTRPGIGRWTTHIGMLASPPHIDLTFLTATLLSFGAVLCLPRQFYVGFIELENTKDISTARWLLPGYLVLTILMVVPILAAGSAVLLPSVRNPDMYVLEIVQQLGGPLLTAFVFLGGFSAAAAMVTVETVALSNMVSNEFVLPLLARTRWKLDPAFNVGRLIVRVRRAAIIVILIFGCLYYQAMDQTEALGQIGLTSFAAVAQLLPALVGGVLWRRGHASGAIGGILAGFAVWLCAIAAPQLLPNLSPLRWLSASLAPWHGDAIFVPAVIVSLGINLALYVAISLKAKPRLIDDVQAAAFISAVRPDERPEQRHELQGTIGDLKALVGQFVGHQDTVRAFNQLGREHGRRFRDAEDIDPLVARAAERMLAGAIGAALARRVIGRQLADKRYLADDVVRVLDEAAQAVQFNRELLHTTLDNLDQGVSVVDADLRLVAWNKRYIELFEFPPRFIYVGKPLDDLLRFGTIKAGFKPEEVEEQVERRMAHIRRRQTYVFERDRADGLVLKIRGTPMPGGRYLTSYTDVTEARRAAHALAQANEHLEERVDSRTRELTVANIELAAAKSVAERATNSQTRFLAAASHDVVQPLQASRLLVATAMEGRAADTELMDMLSHADLAIESADRLLRALLNLSRLEIGGVKIEVRPVHVAVLMRELQREFSMVASEKGLELRLAPTSAWVVSDPDLLRSVLQNLISNAIRYTRKGAVLIGCRRDRQGLRFEVRDSGPGIPDGALDVIFGEFSRLPQGIDAGPGTGLGLSIAERVCRLLGHTLTVRSALGRGSIFSVTVPRAHGQVERPNALTPGALPRGFRVLYIENDESVLASMEALLSRWGATVSRALSREQAMALSGRWDVILADYRLGKDGNGLDAIEAMRGRADIFALLTADPEEEVIERAAGLGVEVISKPVAPLFLRSFLARSLYAMES